MLAFLAAAQATGWSGGPVPPVKTVWPTREQDIVGAIKLAGTSGDLKSNELIRKAYLGL